MKKVCPKCGYCEPDGQHKFCSICGALLVEDKSDSDGYEYDFASSETSDSDHYSYGSDNSYSDYNSDHSSSDYSSDHSSETSDTDDFEFNFGASDPQNQNVNNAYTSGQSSYGQGGYGQAPYRQNGYSQGGFVSQDPTYVPIKMDDRRANKIKKDTFSWTIYLVVICILRFIFLFTELDDVNDIKYYLPYYEGEPIYNTFTTLVNTYYAGIFILVLFMVASIVLTIFAVRMNKNIFPVQDDTIFQDAKKAFYASLATLVVVAVYLILEIICGVVTLRIAAYFDDETISFSTQLLGAFVADILLLAGAIICVVNSRKIATCKV